MIRQVGCTEIRVMLTYNNQYNKTQCPCGSNIVFGKCCGLNPGADYLEMLEFMKRFNTDKPLYRVFDEKLFADRFYNGHVRVSTLEHCRNHENTRARDRKEGVAVVGISPESADVNNNVPVNNTFDALANPEPSIPLVHLGNNTMKLENAYVICFSTSYNNYMKGVYGKYCIKLTSPAAFFYLLNAVMRNLQLIIDIQPGPIVYDDSMFLNLKSMNTLTGLGFYKEERFTYENEYRVRLLPVLPEIEPVLIEITNIHNLCVKMY